MKSCPVCNSQNLSRLNNYDGSELFSKQITLVNCFACDFVFASPMPSDKELKNYNSQYFQNAHGGFSTDPLVLGFRSAINRNRVEYVLDYAKRNSKIINKVFEIGPGSGMFLKHFQGLNPTQDYSVLESDISLHHNFYKEGVTVYQDIMDVPKKNYDLVVCSHVLEHTNDPIQFMNSIYDLLSPYGILFIEVPCQDYLYKKKYEPHLLFFNRESMEKLFSHYKLEKIQISYHGPKIGESFLSKIYREIYSTILQKLYKINRLVIQFLLSKLNNSNSLEEIVAILPYSFLPSNSYPSWWIRAVSIKK